jgi:hypothetical protein
VQVCKMRDFQRLCDWGVDVVMSDFDAIRLDEEAVHDQGEYGNRQDNQQDSAHRQWGLNSLLWRLQMDP